VRHLEITALGEAGVTRAQGHALVAIREMGRPSMAMLASTLGLAPSTVTRLVNPLVQQELVERLPDPDDRRVVGLVLTVAGKRVLKRFEQQMIDAYARVADRIPRGKQGAVREALSTLITAIEHASLDVG
jgi:DNA-binding MarR family transcriptional regulator